MGRCKIPIAKITDTRARRATFSKRSKNLTKKAYELSVLCDTDVAVIVFSENELSSVFSSGPSMEDVLLRFLHTRNTEKECPNDNKARRDNTSDVVIKNKEAIINKVEYLKNEAHFVAQPSSINDYNEREKILLNALHRVNERKEYLLNRQMLDNKDLPLPPPPPNATFLMHAPHFNSQVASNLQANWSDQDNSQYVLPIPHLNIQGSMRIPISQGQPTTVMRPAAQLNVQGGVGQENHISNLVMQPQLNVPGWGTTSQNFYTNLLMGQ